MILQAGDGVGMDWGCDPAESESETIQVSRIIQQNTKKYYGGFRKWEWKTLLKWMIWGYHYFRKHPYEGYKSTADEDDDIPDPKSQFCSGICQWHL